MDKKEAFRTNIGGQALIEGIMMRGPDKTAVVVRLPDGTTEAKEDPYIPLKQRSPLLALPVVRGAVSFVLSLMLGGQALMWAAERALNEETGDPKKSDIPDETADQTNTTDQARDIKPKSKASERGEKVAFTVAIVLGLLLAVGLFTVLPTLIFSHWTGGKLGRNLLETLLRLVILVLYMLLVSRGKDIQRVFSYHGAEHKTIACYEANEELTVENVRRFSRFHPRCGTSFLLMVVLVSLLVFILVSALTEGVLDTNNSLIRIGLKLALLPFVVGFTYEINRFVGAHDNGFTRFLRAPGLWLQRITTREPDDSMIEVGISALTLVIPVSKVDAEWGRE